MAGMPCEHRPAARLCQVADEQTRPAVVLLRVERERLSRIACQALPSTGSARAPARQPFAYPPIACAVIGAGCLTLPNRTFAGVWSVAGVDGAPEA
jgi:hypothetical protein